MADKVILRTKPYGGQGNSHLQVVLAKVAHPRSPYLNPGDSCHQDTEYVTWLRNLEFEGEGLVSGRYFHSLEEALLDYHQRGY